MKDKLRQMNYEQDIFVYYLSIRELFVIKHNKKERTLICKWKINRFDIFIIFFAFSSSALMPKKILFKKVNVKDFDEHQGHRLCN